MNNKKHNIIDDASRMKESQMGGSAHSLRIGLIVNTTINARPVVANNVLDLVVENPKFEAESLREPTLLHVGGGEVPAIILMVHDKDSGHIQCFPFSRDEEGLWVAYEVAFDLTTDGRIEIRPVHPLVEYGDPTKQMMDHLETLATIVGSYIQRMGSGDIYLVEGTEDYYKINKKRVAKGNTAIVNDWKVVYASKQNG